MTLRLVERIATLLRADAHGVVEALEERSLLAKQALREAELELLQKRARLEGLGQDEARLGERAAQLRSELDALDADVELALTESREELARFAIRRLLPLQREHAALERERAALAASRASLTERLAAQEVDLEELRARVRVRLAQGPAGFARDGVPLGPAPVDENEVELELLRRRGAATREGGSR